MQKVSNKFLIKLVSVPILMFGFAYLLVPLYDVLCEVTGFAGRTGKTTLAQANASVIDENRKVKVEFLSMKATGFNVDFVPEKFDMEVVPGKVYQMNYLADNRSDQRVIGQAIPSVAPPEAAINFKKIECFCFNRQTFEPREKVTMPVIFIVQPALDDGVKNITLSYNFIKLEDS